MPHQISTYRYRTRRLPDEGLRIGTTRYLPRGVSKADYAALDYFDVYLPILAPSRELLKWYRAEDPSVEEFYRRYRREMKTTDSRQTIALLREVSMRTPITLGCFCEDATRCHRTALAQLIAADVG